jgi:RNA polymerase primary sigma factor
MSEINPFLNALIVSLAAKPNTKHGLYALLSRSFLVDVRTINQYLYRYEGICFQKDRSPQDGLPIWSLIRAPHAVQPTVVREVSDAAGNPLKIRNERWDRLREWQQEAIRKWRENGERGIVEAVTGAGKSDVAIALAEHYLNHGTRVLILVHTNALKDQWADKLREGTCNHLGIDVSVVKSSTSGAWRHSRVLIAHPPTVAKAIAAGRLDPNSIGLVVADEVHHYGADKWQQALDEHFVTRLGLSATIERGEAGFIDVLEPYFGGIVYELGFDRAYGYGLLAPFRLAYVGCNFSETEQHAFDELSAQAKKARRNLNRLCPDIANMQGSEFFSQLSRLSKNKDDREVGIAASALLSAFTAKRELCATCDGKLALLPELLRIAAQRSQTIVFAQTKEAARLASQVSASVGVAGANIDADTPPAERTRIFDQFRSGEIRVLAGPKLLDEGLDIPVADFGIVISASRSRRQMVQRFGRLLRKKPDDGDAAIAVMYVVGTNEDPAHSSRDGFISDLEDLADPPFEVFVGEDDAAGLREYLLP